jgi:hypothetical protein
VITGQVPTGAIGTDAFQECDTIGITRSVTARQLMTSAQTSRRCGRRSTSPPPRPGPVLLDIPKDIVDQNPLRHGLYWPMTPRWRAPGYKPRPDPRKIREAGAIARPVIYAGGGILKARPPSARAGRVRHPRRHHADGPGRLPRLHQFAWACWACTATTPRSRDAAATSSSPCQPLDDRIAAAPPALPAKVIHVVDPPSWRPAPDVHRATAAS